MKSWEEKRSMHQEKSAGEGPVHGRRKETGRRKENLWDGRRKQDEVGTGSGYRNKGHYKDGPGMRGQEGGGRKERTGCKEQEVGTEMKDTIRKGQEGGTGRRGQGERNRKWIKKYRKQ